MSKEQKASAGSVGFLGFLTLIFITLKLVGVIDWPWWLVVLPFYGPIFLAVALIGVVVIALAISEGTSQMIK